MACRQPPRRATIINAAVIKQKPTKPTAAANNISKSLESTVSPLFLCFSFANVSGQAAMRQHR
jgi:hypothetical protein